MRTLLQTLYNTDEAILHTIAQSWGITDFPAGKQALADQIETVMLDAESAEQAWAALPDDQRQALQTLLGSQGQMQMSMFKHLFGEIRKMGRGGVEREQPHKNPETAAEALFYKGFISEQMRMGAVGSQAFAYVPDDLVLVLPTHKTGYDDLPPPAEKDALSAVDARNLNETRPADTSIVDDMTAFLAFIQLHTPPVRGNSLVEDSLRALMPYLLTHGTARVAFMLAVGVDANLITIREGNAYTNRDTVRGWLAAPRSEQLETLIRAWLDSELYRELYQLPEIEVESAPGYDPRLARRLLQKALKETVPPAEWWEIDPLIYIIKQSAPDFQRPNGDFDSWYLVDLAGEYLRGFDSWDAAEGLQLEAIIRGPFHWLGLVDIAPEAARLTAYGRGVIGVGNFPHPADEPEQVQIHPDGRLSVSRKVARIDRFQVARFTTWEEAPPLGSDAAFTYRLDRAGVASASTQDITPDHIRAFLSRVADGEPIPEKMEAILKNWRGGGDTSVVTLSQMVVLQTTSAQVLDELDALPEIRRYFGKRLGERAVAVRPENWDALHEALEAMGMEVHTR